VNGDAAGEGFVAKAIHRAQIMITVEKNGSQQGMKPSIVLYTVNTSTGIHFTIADSNESSLVATTAIPRSRLVLTGDSRSEQKHQSSFLTVMLSKMSADVIGVVEL